MRLVGRMLRKEGDAAQQRGSAPAAAVRIPAGLRVGRHMGGFIAPPRKAGHSAHGPEPPMPCKNIGACACTPADGAVLCHSLL